MIASVAAVLMFVGFYCYKVGGPRQAVTNFRAMNWRWLAFDVGLPIGIPVGIGILVIVGAFLLGVDGAPIDLGITVEELTPWTLCFFSMTILAAALRRYYYSKERTFWTLLSGALLFIVSAFALALTVMKHLPGWKPSFRPYSTAILLTLISIWMSHARDEPKADVTPEI